MSINNTPKSVLFVCNMNQIRSPMAEFLARKHFGTFLYIRSAGIFKGKQDGFMQTVLKEQDIDISKHIPETLDELDDHYVDIVITLTNQAHEKTVDFFRGQAVDIEFWDIENPSNAVGSREQILDAYRKTLKDIDKRIHQRFSNLLVVNSS